jgi:hypothetical protein
MLLLFSIRMAVLLLEPTAPRHGCSRKAVLRSTDALGTPLDIFKMDDGAALNADAPPADRRSIAEACVCVATPGNVNRLARSSTAMAAQQNMDQFFGSAGSHSIQS